VTAKTLLAVTSGYPRPGSLQEDVFHLLIAKQEFNAMEQVRLGLQAAVNPDNIKEMWKEFTEAVFPLSLIHI
jgi:hypothetical protein